MFPLRQIHLGSESLIRVSHISFDYYKLRGDVTYISDTWNLCVGRQLTYIRCLGEPRWERNPIQLVRWQCSNIELIEVSIQGFLWYHSNGNYGNEFETAQFHFQMPTKNKHYCKAPELFLRIF
jgi:hypothetical protein